MTDKPNLQLVEHIAKAIAEAFWREAEQPRPWEAHSHQHKEVWRSCARSTIQAARDFKAQRQAA